MTRHANGPWTDSGSATFMGGVSYRNVVSDTGSHFVTVAVVPGYDDPQGEANARLIAAAPELLEALEWLVSDLQSDGCEEHIPMSIYSARAAIAKARGE